MGLRLYGHYKIFYSFSAEIDLRRQILTSTDGPHTVRVNILSQSKESRICLFPLVSQIIQPIFHKKKFFSSFEALITSAIHNHSRFNPLTAGPDYSRVFSFFISTLSNTF